MGDSVPRRVLDVVVAVAGLLVLAVPMIMIALAIRADDVGPALAAHRRLGQRGRPFAMYKFRASAASATGLFLRRTGLDDLPQLLNVVHGTMSLTGPAPCLEWQAELFPSEFHDRFAARPGLTGCWRPGGPSTTGTLQLLHRDLAYVRQRRLPGSTDPGSG